jgi:uncharacterized protein (DUF433 family)
MKNAEELNKEIKEILSAPFPWGPMTMTRIRTALKQASESLSLYNSTNKMLGDKLNFYEGTRSDTKLSRNMTILKMFEEGETVASLVKKYNLTRQRIHKIILTTRQYLGQKHGAASITKVSGRCDQSPKRKAVAGIQKNRPTGSNRRR